MNRKGIIVGTIIGVIIGLSVATYAQTFNYSITGKIIIPEDVDVQITGFTEDDLGNLILPDILLNDDTGTCRIGITNTGSATFTVTWTATTNTPHLSVELEGYIEHSITGNAFVDGLTTLERGAFMDCLLSVTDDGETPPGDHEFTLVIEVTG